MKKTLLFALLGFALSGCEINTLHNYEITVLPRHWRQVGTYGQPGYYLEASFTADYITRDVLNRGAVLVYAEFSEATVQLPHIFSRQVRNSRFVETLAYELRPGLITFTLDDSDFETDPYDTPVTFRIVVIH
jgi:hypothetical protein